MTIIDERLGLITAVEQIKRDVNLPGCWIGYRARVADISRVTDWVADPIGFGASFGDVSMARGAAIGEAVERYCGNSIPPNLRRSSYRDLTFDGEDALAPGTFALYSTAQYTTPGFPFVPFEDDLTVEWVRGQRPRADTEVWVPAISAYLNYIRGHRLDEPRLHSLMYSGIATGMSRRDAERRALEELIERDATSIWWASGAGTPAIDDDGMVTGQMGHPVDGGDIHVTLVHIPSQFGVPVIGALVHDRSQSLIAFGSACRASPHAAATKALVEALGSLQLSRQLADPDSETWQSVRQGALADHVFLPFRSDRSYADDAGPGFRNLVDLPAVAQLYQDPRIQDLYLPRLRPTTTITMADIPEVGGDLRETYLDELLGAGIDVAFVDLTTFDVARGGFSVVRAIAPQLVGNGPPAFPLHGSNRLIDTPARLAWDVQPHRTSDLVTAPLPLA